MPIRLAEPTAHAYGYPLLLKQLLHTARVTAPDQEIVYRDRFRYRYRDFDGRLARLASGLAGLGVNAGTTVAVMDWDSHRYLECFFAVPMMGAVLQTVNVRLSPAQVEYTLKHAGAEVILVHRDFVPMLESMRARLPALRAVVLIDDFSSESTRPTWAIAEYEELLASSSSAFEFIDFDENAIATTFYTTGTTGDPKAVCFSHRQLVLHTLALLGACASPAHGQSFRHGDVYMPMTPMFHVHAWGNPFVATLLGVKQVYPGRYVSEELLALRAREGVTYSHCVPTVLQMLLKAAEATGASLHGWKMCIGGAALSHGLAREALAHGIDVYAGYGMSETGPVMTVSRLQQSAEVVGDAAALAIRCRTGLPIPLVELRVVDAGLADVPHDGQAVGELVVRAPWLTPCYVGDAAASAQLWQGGYLHTQDVAWMDQAGYVQITDRVKDVIKTGGEWLSSLQLENLISVLADVAEVAVIGVPDERWGERPHVLVVPRSGANLEALPDAVRAHVSAAAQAGVVPRYATPERVTVVEALARTSVGKIDKKRLRERFN
jgi:fatty-acyl-CoA synthase